MAPPQRVGPAAGCASAASAVPSSAINRRLAVGREANRLASDRLPVPMARPRLNTLNFVYTAVGLAVASGIGYYVYRRIRNRRFESGAEETGLQGRSEESLMDLRRSSRKAGRAIKDTGSQIGKTVKRGASDVGESFEDATSSGKELLADTTGSSTGNTSKSRY
jgi:hypothetical protein